jgi:integrase/recombinase XerD
MELIAIEQKENMLNVIKNGDWIYLQELKELILEDGKYLSFKKLKEEYVFLSFFLYENKYRKESLSENTEKVYLHDLKQFIEYLFSLSIRLFDVGIVELDGYEKHIIENYASSTADRKLKLVRSLLRFGFATDYFERDMSHYVRLPKIKRVKQERKLNRKEMNKLLEEMKKKPLNRVVGGFLSLLGLRISELCNLVWGDIYEGTNGTVMLKVLGKGNKVRHLRVRPDLFGLLLQYRASKGMTIIIGRNSDEPLIVNSRGSRLNDRVVRYMVSRAAKRVKIEKEVSPHWFRHSAITFAAYDGAPLNQVRKMAGHADIRTTDIYFHDLEDEIQQSASEYISGLDI